MPCTVERPDILRHAKRLFIHAGKQKIYYSIDQSTVYAFDSSNCHEFVAKLPTYVNVYMAATRSNLALINSVYNKVCNDGKLYLCSPYYIYLYGLEDEAAIRDTKRFNGIAASIGGWHAHSDIDQIIYQAAWANSIGIRFSDEDAKKFLMNHPLYYHLKFLHFSSHTHMLRLLAEILDIRWFVHPRKLGRNSRLEKYFRVQNAVLMRMLQGCTCKSCNRLRILYDLIEPKYQLQSYATSKDPKFALVAKVANKSNDLRRMLYMMRSYLTYLYYGWLEVCSNHPECTFDPETFFGDQDMTSAYRNRIS
jgi:hypothetical protein